MKLEGKEEERKKAEKNKEGGREGGSSKVRVSLCQIPGIGIWTLETNNYNNIFKTSRNIYSTRTINNRICAREFLSDINYDLF